MNRILLIDDEQIGSHITSQKLKSCGFQVDSLKTVDLEGLYEKIKDYDLLLLDIMMPDITGIEILHFLRKELNASQFPIIMMTSKKDVSDIVNALENGANDYITKPINIDITVSRIMTQLKIVELNRENERNKQFEAINSMIVTYHHELNNPLSIAYGALQIAKKKIEDHNGYLEKIENGLQRIIEIIRKIKEIKKIDASSELEYERYDGESKYLKIK